MSLSRYFCTAVAVGLLAIVLTAIFKEELLVRRSHPSNFPRPSRRYWGKPGTEKQQQSIERMIPFINVNKDKSGASNTEELVHQFVDLWLQRESTNPFNHQPFVNSPDDVVDYNTLSSIEGRGYGLNYADFKQLVTYYNNTFDWTKYKQVIQSFQHYTVKIRGLDIHFIRHSLNTIKKATSGNKKIQAVMLLHGWPSSFWEFHRLLQIFEAQYTSSAIDVVIPSLPGYGFSEYPMQYSGFTTMSVAEIFRELMESVLNYDRYIVVGGDWGSVVAHHMAYLVVDEVDEAAKKNANKHEYQQALQGILICLPLSSPPLHELLLLSLNVDAVHTYIAKKYNVSVDRVKQAYSPMFDKLLYKMWDMTGYQHEHATRANTIGIALQSSPVSHLAWMYEKYVSWSDCRQMDKYEANGNRVLSGDVTHNGDRSALTWDDVLVTNQIFNLNGKISSAIRYYTESIFNAYRYMPSMYMPDSIRVGIVHWHGDPFDIGIFDKWNYHRIVMKKDHEDGGHFPALEQPQSFYQDIIEFIDTIEIELSAE